MVALPRLAGALLPEEYLSEPTSGLAALALHRARE
jgi:hypothetical protein